MNNAAVVVAIANGYGRRILDARIIVQFAKEEEGHTNATLLLPASTSSHQIMMIMVGIIYNITTTTTLMRYLMLDIFRTMDVEQ